MVINDARAIMYDYRRNYTFAPEVLHAIDYNIEGSYGIPISLECFDEYQPRRSRSYGEPLYKEKTNKGVEKG